MSDLSADELLRLLEDVSAELVDVSEAARRARVLETEPGRYNCGTCQFFKGGECWIPGQPPRLEHSHSVRCGQYRWRDLRAEALPVEAVTARGRKSKMFK